MKESKDRPAIPARHSSIFRPAADVDGIRLVESLASAVSVFAASSDRIKQLIGFGRLTDRPLTYILCAGTTAYIGRSGNGERRLADQVGERPECQHVYVVCSSDSRTGMQTARYFEAKFIELAIDAGLRLTNRARPHAPDMSLPELADHERLLIEARYLLYDAGCRVLEKHCMPPDQRNAGVTIGPVSVPADAPAFELRARGLWARAVSCRGSFLVMPGSDFATVATRSLTRPIVRRRNELMKQGIARAIAGAPDHMRLVAWVECKSPALAAKLITGWQVNASVWTPADHCPLVYVAM
jgi:hypothetical protein